MSNLQPPQPTERQDVPREVAERNEDEIASDKLLAGGREVRIRHQGEVYRLRLTRNGKLILHK